MADPTEPTVYAAFSAVMESVQGIRKNQRNFDQNFNFRGIDAVLNTVGPKLREHGVIIVPTAEHIEVERYQTAKGSHMLGVIVRMRYRVIGPAGDSFEGSAFGQAADSGDKAVAKAESVAYRTFLLQSLTVPTDDPDPDQFSHERGPAQPPPVPPVPPELQAARDRVWDAAAGHGDGEARTAWIAGALAARGLTMQTATAADLHRMADEWAEAAAEATTATAAAPATEETP